MLTQQSRTADRTHKVATMHDDRQQAENANELRHHEIYLFGGHLTLHWLAVPHGKIQPVLVENGAQPTEIRPTDRVGGEDAEVEPFPFIRNEVQQAMVFVPMVADQHEFELRSQQRLDTRSGKT